MPLRPLPLSFSADDHARIAGAIRDAERGTSGEIYAVFARRSDDYGFVAATVALLLSMLTALLVVLVAAMASVPMPALSVEIGQAVGAAFVFMALRLSQPLRMLFVPRTVARARASRLAAAQFLAHNLHSTRERTGVLIFVSEAERHAEVLADEGISSLTPQRDWDAIVAVLTEAARSDRLADGYVEAIGRAGALLSGAFPPRGDNPNELPDRLVEI